MHQMQPNEEKSQIISLSLVPLSPVNFQLIFTQERNNTLFLVLVLLGVGCLLVQQKPPCQHVYKTIIAS